MEEEGAVEEAVQSSELEITVTISRVDQEVLLQVAGEVAQGEWSTPLHLVLLCLSMVGEEEAVEAAAVTVHGVDSTITVLGKFLEAGISAMQNYSH